jgi:hypothetical protein
VQTLATRRHRFDAFTIRLSVPADKAGSIRPPTTTSVSSTALRRSGSGQAKAVRHDTPLGREDMDPIGRTFELVICRFKRGCRTGELHAVPTSYSSRRRF